MTGYDSNDHYEWPNDVQSVRSALCHSVVQVNIQGHSTFSLFIHAKRRLLLG